jgi:hypothetical protein
MPVFSSGIDETGQQYNITSELCSAEFALDFIDRKRLVQELYQKKLLIKSFQAWQGQTSESKVLMMQRGGRGGSSQNILIVD